MPSVSGRRYHHPAFVLRWNVGIFQKPETDLVTIELDGFVVVSDYQGNETDRLVHGSILDLTHNSTYVDIKPLRIPRS
jgi:hypothetical protein